MKKKTILWVWVIIFLIVHSFNPFAAASQGNTIKTILYVNSYHPGYAWSDDILDGIRAVLKHTENIELKVEYLDAKNHHSQEYFKKVQTVFEEKYRGKTIDAVITSDDHALDFVLNIRKDLFPSCPLVFCGVDHVTPRRMAGHDRVYEIRQGKATKGTLEMALKLQPGAQDVYFVSDTTKTGKSTLEGALQLEPEYRGQLGFHYIWDTSEAQLIQTLGKIPKEAIVLYFTFLKDKENKTFSLTDSMKLVSQNAEAPVYCTWGFKPDLGIIGGAIMNGFKQGEFSIETVLRLLDPKNSQAIPKSQTAPLAYMIDDKAFEAAGLERRFLPEKSLIFNQSITFYDDYQKYKPQFWAAIAVMLVLLAFVLLFQNRSRTLAALNQKYREEIHERKRMAAALKESEEKFRTFFLLGNVGMAITSPDKGWIQVNPQLCEMLGYPENQLRRSNWEALTHPDDLAVDVNQFNRVFKGEIDNYTLEKRFVRKDGSILHTTLWLACLRHDDGAVKHFIALLSDNTERIKADEEKQALEVHLRQQQKMESIGTLAGGVAHEINNPINGILNYAQLISDKQDRSSLTLEYANEIIRESNRIAKIVKALLTFSRMEKETHSPARLVDIVESVLSLIKTILSKDNIAIEVYVSEDLPKIKCRSQQIQQVMMNLVINARDALNEKYPQYDENKKISIRSRLFHEDGRRWISTIVQDNGNGIAPGILDQIFDPFFTSKPKHVGTGLGLSISYGIIKAHHGNLTVESEFGLYAKFNLVLPVDNGWGLNQTTESGEKK